MAVHQFYVGFYARSIYIGGTQRFTARDGFSGIPQEYHEPVMRYAATNYIQTEIDTAQSNGWINQAEYDQTMSYQTAA